MRRLIVSEWMTLDGVVQAPTSPQEDSDGGFEHGGWHRPHMGDPAFRQWVLESVAARRAPTSPLPTPCTALSTCGASSAAGGRAQDDREWHRIYSERRDQGLEVLPRSTTRQTRR